MDSNRSHNPRGSVNNQRGFPPARKAANRNAARTHPRTNNDPAFPPHPEEPQDLAPYSRSAYGNHSSEQERYAAQAPSGYIPPSSDPNLALQGTETSPDYVFGQHNPPPFAPVRGRQAYYPPGSEFSERIPHEKQRSFWRTSLKILGWTLLISLILLAVVMATSWWTLRNTAGAIFNTDTQTTLVTKAPVVASLKQVNKQVFIEHNNMVDVDYSEAPEGWLSYLPIEQSFVVLLRGTVPAGFDLSSLSEENIWISEDGKKIQLVLPPPVVFEDSVSIAFEDSRVLTEGDTCPNFICSEDLDAIQQAIIPQGRVLLIETSLNSGIMKQAAEMGIRYYESLLRSFGFEEVQVLVQTDLEVKPASE